MISRLVGHVSTDRLPATPPHHHRENGFFMHTNLIDLMYAFGDHDAYPADVLELGFTVEQIDAAVDAGYLDHDGEIVRLTEDGVAFLEAAVAAADDAAMAS